MKTSSVVFKTLLAICLLLVAGVLATRGIEAYRMRDPDYARMLADREHFEKVISKSGLPLHPASYWTAAPGKSGADGGKGK